MSVQDRVRTDPSAATRNSAEAADVVVRRGRFLPSLVAVAAALLTGAYVWRGLHSTSAYDWVMALVVGVVAVGQLILLADARTPLLVADSTGVRVRSGRRWRGLRWADVRGVDVRSPRLWRAGRIDVHPTAAAENAMTLRVGAATVSSAADLGAALRSLADSATMVAAPAEPAPEQLPEPDVSPDPGASLEPDPMPEREDGAQLPASAPDGSAPALQPTAVSAQSQRPVPAVLRVLRPALRADVTKPSQTRPPLTVGTSALADPHPASEPGLLPEFSQLRRSGPGNVSLLVSAGESQQPQDAPEAVTPDGLPEGLRRAADATGDADEPDNPHTGAEPVLGRQLAAARLWLGLSIDDLAVRTRIRPHVIEALERDDFEPCGGDFYARGHLRALARVVGIDPEPLVRAYDDRYASGPINPRTVFGADLATGSRGALRSAETGPNWGALIAVVLVLVLVWGLARLLTDDTPPAGDVPALTGSSSLG